MKKKSHLWERDREKEKKRLYNIYILNLYSKLPNSSVNLSKQLNISCLCTFKFQILQVINVGGHKYIAISFRVSLNGILRSNNAAITQKMQIKKKTDIKWKICKATNVLSVFFMPCLVSILQADKFFENRFECGMTHWATEYI